MKIYKVHCYSTCGSYFSSYLQSVTVIAENETDAVNQVDKWLKKEGRNFIYDKSKWCVYLISEKTDGIIDYHEDSDY